MTEKENYKQNTGRSGGKRTMVRSSGQNKEADFHPAEHQQKGKLFQATNRTAERIKALAAERKKRDRENTTSEDGKEKIGRWVQIRLLPIWLRVLLFLIGAALAAVLGVMFGFGVIGDGKASDALKPETWQHIWKMIKGDV